MKTVMIGDVLALSKDRARVDTPSTATLISVKLHGKGAVPRAVGDGKAPAPFTGYRARAGQFVMSRIWARRGAMAIVPEGLDGVVVTNEFPLFDIDQARLSGAYLNRFVQSPQFIARLERSSSGASGQNRVKEADFLNLDMPLPSLDEQRRIAAVLDHAETSVSLQERVLMQLDDLAAATFKAVVSKCTDGTVRLGDVSDWKSGGTPSRSNSGFFGGDVPWFSSGELGSLFIEGAKETLTEEGVRSSSAKLTPAGSLFVGMYDTAALKSSISRVTAACNQAVAFSDINPDVASSVFVYYAIQDVKNRVLQQRRGIRQKNLNLSMIRDIEIPRVSTCEQGRFESVVRSISVRRAEKLAMLDASKRLAASLQWRAFRGEL